MSKKYILNGEELDLMDNERAKIVAEQATLEGHKVVVTDTSVEVTVVKLETTPIERDEEVVDTEKVVALFGEKSDGESDDVLPSSDDDFVEEDEGEEE